MPNNRFKIPLSVLVPVVVVVLVTVLGFLARGIASNAGEISTVKADTKVNTTVIQIVAGRLEHIQASLDRLEERFNTRPKR